MFGIKSFKDLDMMTIMLIAVVIILVIYLIRRSSIYSSKLIEGNTLRNKNQQNDTKYKFSKAIEKWEASTLKMKKNDVDDINTLANAIMNDLNYNKHSDDYKEIIADLENIANSFSVILCVDMTKQLNKMSEHSTTEDSAVNDILNGIMMNALNINSLQEFKRNLVDIHSWTPMPTSSSSSDSNIFGGSNKSSSKSKSNSSSNFF